MEIISDFKKYNHNHSDDVGDGDGVEVGGDCGGGDYFVGEFSPLTWYLVIRSSPVSFDKYIDCSQHRGRIIIYIIYFDILLYIIFDKK